MAPNVTYQQLDINLVWRLAPQSDSAVCHTFPWIRFLISFDSLATHMQPSRHVPSCDSFNTHKVSSVLVCHGASSIASGTASTFIAVHGPLTGITWMQVEIAIPSSHSPYFIARDFNGTRFVFHRLTDLFIIHFYSSWCSGDHGRRLQRRE